MPAQLWRVLLSHLYHISLKFCHHTPELGDLLDSQANDQGCLQSNGHVRFGCQPAVTSLSQFSRYQRSKGLLRAAVQGASFADGDQLGPVLISFCRTCSEASPADLAFWTIYTASLSEACVLRAPVLTAGNYVRTAGSTAGSIADPRNMHPGANYWSWQARLEKTLEGLRAVTRVGNEAPCATLTRTTFPTEHDSDRLAQANGAPSPEDASARPFFSCMQRLAPSLNRLMSLRPRQV